MLQRKYFTPLSVPGVPKDVCNTLCDISATALQARVIWLPRTVIKFGNIQYKTL